GVRRLFADRTDAAALRTALAGQDFDVVHDVNAYRPEDVRTISGLLRGQIGHYVFVSSTVIYAASNWLPIGEDQPLDRSPQQNEYGRLKIECEDFLVREYRERGFQATIVALSMVIGPNNILPDREQRMFARLLAERPIPIPGDGTTLAQVGQVEDQARALRMLMANPKTFGRRYNLTGGDYFSAEGYVDTFAAVVGVEPRKVFVPARLMDDLYAGRELLAPGEVQAKIDIRSQETPGALLRQRFLLTFLVQRLAPHIHPWNRSVVFSVDRLRENVGWKPELTFPAAVEHTYAWFRQQRLHETAHFDWSWEDQLLGLVGAGPR
ncbi:MAG: NAD-dependent epimerase/dehydratase family protein, partial [Myxococcales bacterium]